VRLMGTFDGWTHGQSVRTATRGLLLNLTLADPVSVFITHVGLCMLQLHSISESADTYREFRGEIMLRPGRYEVKLQVDGVWVLISDLPTTGGDGYDANNVIVIS